MNAPISRQTPCAGSLRRLVGRLANLRQNWMFRTFWYFGNWLAGPLKWRFGKRWLEVEYTGTAFKHFAWSIYDANNWKFKDALEKLGWAIKDIRIVMWHRRRRLASNESSLAAAVARYIKDARHGGENQ